MVFDAHDRACAFFGGVPRRMLDDNPKTLVALIFAGKERRFNRRFLARAKHDLVEALACTPAAGWEKGAGGDPSRQPARVAVHAAPAVSRFRRAKPMAAGALAADRIRAKQAHPRPVDRPLDGDCEPPWRATATASRPSPPDSGSRCAPGPSRWLSWPPVNRSPSMRAASPASAWCAIPGTSCRCESASAGRCALRRLGVAGTDRGGAGQAAPAAQRRPRLRRDAPGAARARLGVGQRGLRAHGERRRGAQPCPSAQGPAGGLRAPAPGRRAAGRRCAP